jgi:PAS domain S-box-containing protein
MRKKAPHSNPDLPKVSRSVELLRALNVAAASLQRSAHSEAELFRAVSEQIAGLDLRGSLSLLDEKDERLVVRLAVYPSQTLASLEQLTGLKAEGFKFAVAKADAYRQVVETGKTVFAPNSATVVAQLLPEAAQPFVEHILKALSTSPGIYAPVIIDNRVRWVLTIVGPGLTPDDLPAMEAFANHLAVALDNARLYAETRATRDYYNTLLNSLHDQILVINRDYVITDVNEPLLRATGYTRQQVIGRHCYQIGHGLDVPCWQHPDHPCPIVEVWQTGRASGATHTHRDRAGRSITINIALSPLLDESGVVIGVIEAYRDVTTEKRLEERLEAIYQLGQELTLLRDEAAIVQRVLEKAVGVLQFEMAGCGLVDEATGELVYHYVFGAAPRITGETPTLRMPLDGRAARGISVAVVQSGRAINVPDTTQDARYVPFPEDSPCRSELCVPMKIGDRVIGVLDAESVEPNHFTQADQQLLQSLADQIVVALQNAWLFNQVRQRAIQLQTAAEVSRAATSVLELNQLLPQAVELIRERFGLYYVGLFLVDEVGEWAVLQAGTGKAGQTQLAQRHRLKVGGESMVGWCVANARARIALDVGQEAIRFDNPLLPDTRSEMALPLVSRGEIIGALSVQSTRPAAFSQEDITTLQTMADQLANAIENARSYQAERARRQELEAIQQASLSLTASLELPQVLDAILHAALNLVSAQDAHIFLYDEGRLTFGAALWMDGRRETPYDKPRPNGLTYAVAQQGESIIVPDLPNHPLFADAPPDWVGAIASLPLKIGQRVVGVMNIARPVPGTFSEAQLRALRLLADQAAIAIENARLHEDLHAQLDALRHAQTRLVQSEKLAAIGELVAGVAHELNNPLTSIIGFAQLLQHSQMDDQSQQDLDKIVAQARRAASIVRGLLDFARQYPPERKPVLVNDVLDSTLDLLAYELRIGNIEWTTHYSNDLPLTMADPQQLQQVFVNLVHNACQAMGEAHSHGHLTVTSELGRPAFLNRQHKAQPVIRVIVQDDGPGIPDDIMPHIFNPFFTTKPPGEGTGLGLAVCHGIVSEHGGHIWAETAQTQDGSPGGATFFVELPVIPPEMPHHPGASGGSQHPMSPGAIRVLVVDDEQEVLEMVVRTLRREGYQVDAVSDGETALNRLAETNYDLILCDVRMSGLSGQEVYRQIVAQNLDLARCIVFITGDTVSPATRRFLKETGASYLGKPFELADLLQKVQAIATKHKLPIRNRDTSLLRPAKLDDQCPESHQA